MTAKYRMNSKFMKSILFVFFATLLAPIADAANMRVTSLSTGTEIVCSDATRAYVFDSLSARLSQIEADAWKSASNSKINIARLNAVINRSTTLAKSNKYAWKLTYQCTLVFVAEACRESMERITGDDALSDAWNISDTPVASDSSTQVTSPAPAPNSTPVSMPVNVVVNKTLNWTPNIPAATTSPAPTTNTSVQEEYSNPKEATVRKMDEISKMMSCRGTEELIAPWTQSNWGRDWMTSEIACDAGSWSEATGRALIQDRCDGTSNFNVSFDAKTKGSWVKGNSITFGSNGLVEYNIIAGSVESVTCSGGRVSYRCNVSAIRCDAN